MDSNEIDSLTVKLKLKYNKSSIDALERVKKTFDSISSKSFGISAATKKMSSFGTVVSKAFSSTSFRAGIKGITLLSGAFTGLSLATSSYIKKQSKVMSQQKLLSSYFNVSQSSIQGMSSQYKSMGLEMGVATSAMQRLQGVAGNRAMGKINMQDYRVMSAVGAKDMLSIYQRQDLDAAKKLDLLSQAAVKREASLRASHHPAQAAALRNQFPKLFMYGKQQQMLTKASGGKNRQEREDDSIKNLFGTKDAQKKYSDLSNKYALQMGSLRESREGLWNVGSSSFATKVMSKGPDEKDNAIDRLRDSLNGLKPAMEGLGSFIAGAFKDSITGLTVVLNGAATGFNTLSKALGSLEKTSPVAAKALEGISVALGVVIAALGPIWLARKGINLTKRALGIGGKASGRAAASAKAKSTGAFSKAEKENIKARADNYKEEMRARDNLRKAKVAKSEASYKYPNEPESGKFHQSLNKKVADADAALKDTLKKGRAANEFKPIKKGLVRGTFRAGRVLVNTGAKGAVSAAKGLGSLAKPGVMTAARVLGGAGRAALSKAPGIGRVGASTINSSLTKKAASSVGRIIGRSIVGAILSNPILDGVFALATPQTTGDSKLRKFDKSQNKLISHPIYDSPKLRHDLDARLGLSNTSKLGATPAPSAQKEQSKNITNNISITVNSSHEPDKIADAIKNVMVSHTLEYAN